MNRLLTLLVVIAVLLAVLMATPQGNAQDDGSDADDTRNGQQRTASEDAPEEDAVDKDTAEAAGDEISAEGAPMASEEDVLAAEDAAVDEVLTEAELIYRDDGEDGDFIPSEQVSADQSLDYPIDI